jgi:hypothetical protein
MTQMREPADGTRALQRVGRRPVEPMLGPPARRQAAGRPPQEAGLRRALRPQLEALRPATMPPRELPDGMRALQRGGRRRVEPMPAVLTGAALMPEVAEAAVGATVAKARAGPMVAFRTIRVP